MLETRLAQAEDDLRPPALLTHQSLKAKERVQRLLRRTLDKSAEYRFVEQGLSDGSGALSPRYGSDPGARAEHAGKMA